MRRPGRVRTAWMALLVSMPLACASGGEEETPPLEAGFDTGSPGDAAGSEGLVLDDTLPVFDVTTDGSIANCRIATLGIPGDAGVGDIFAKWLDKSGAKASSALLDQVLTASLIAPYKMIVVQNVIGNHAYSAEEAKVLADWVKAGGGLMTLTGFADPSEIVNVNRLLAPFGMSYGSTPILFGGGTTVAVDVWVPHPVTKGVTKIGIDNGYPVLGTGTMLAKGGGYDVLEVAEVGSGHVVVWGDEWITFNSEWSAHPDYQVQTFWQDIVDWFAPGASCKVPDPPK